VTYWNLVVYLAGAPILAAFRLFYFGTYLPHLPRDGKEEMGWQKSHSFDGHPLLSFLQCYQFGYHWEHHRWGGALHRRAAGALVFRAEASCAQASLLCVGGAKGCDDEDNEQRHVVGSCASFCWLAGFPPFLVLRNTTHKCAACHFLVYDVFRWPYAPWWQLHVCKGITRRLEAEGKFSRQPPGKQRLLWE
jgi:hypothetical protein